MGKSDEEGMDLRIPAVLRYSVLPIFALTGLTIGVLLRFGFGRSDLADWAWLAPLIVGGLPIVLQTFKVMLRGQFASDIVAMLAIVTAVLLGQWFAGAVVVLMQSGGEA